MKMLRFRLHLSISAVNRKRAQLGRAPAQRDIRVKEVKVESICVAHWEPAQQVIFGENFLVLNSLSVETSRVVFLI